MIPFSILDLAPISQGSTAGDALRNTLDLAQHAERWGFQRYWLAEHHNMPGIACAATSIVIAHVAAGTKTMRVGSGGVMLPNHAPLVVAEQFGTLESLFPGRIDLGLGRAPGTDGRTARALRRDPVESADQFPEDVLELQSYFEDAGDRKVRAIPGAGLHVPIWLLGSSLFSAHLASMLGLPFAFASHFAPDALMPAIEVYRANFRPSRQLQSPYVMLGVNIFAADTDAEARRQFTSVQQAFALLRRGMPSQVPPPIDNIDAFVTPTEREGIDHALRYSFVGAPDTIRNRLQEFIGATGADELIVAGHFYEHAARLHSFELTAKLHADLVSARHSPSSKVPK